jgi:hypothetical protein
VRLAAVLVSLVAASLLATTLAVGGGDRSKPTLRVARAAPLALVGNHFRARERVRVTVKAAGMRRAKAVRAGRRGRFVARFPALTVDRCNADWFAVATGATGSRAAVKLPQLQCPLPLAPGSP